MAPTGRCRLDRGGRPGDPCILVEHRRAAAGAGRAIIVTTPLSGWFSSAGERGSGIAAFLLGATLPAADAPRYRLAL